MDTSGATQAATAQMAMPATPQISAGANAVGAVLGGLIVAQIEITAAQKRAFNTCMLGAGYVYARLTPQEQKAYDLMSDGQRRTWLAAFLQSERSVEATRRLAPPLPKGPQAPKFDIAPGSYALADGQKKLGDTLITARATATALRLKTPFTYERTKASVAAGEIFLASAITVPTPIVNGVSISFSEPAWCAPATVAGAKVQDRILCLVDVNDGHDGYRVAFTRVDAATDAVNLHLFDAPEPELLTTPLEFAEADLGLVEVRYVLRRPRSGPDTLVGAAIVNGRSYLVNRVAAGKDGVIQIELGSDMARLTPSGKGKDVTYAAALVDPAVSASFIAQRDKALEACGLSQRLSPKAVAEKPLSAAEHRELVACVKAAAQPMRP